MLFAHTLGTTRLTFIDPSGHTSVGTCTLYQDGECVRRVNGTELDRYRALIYAEYGVVLVDTGSSHGNGAGAKAWDLVSVKQVYDALGIFDDNLGGHLKSLIGGSTFTSNKYDTEGKYHANTGKGYIDFKTGGNFPPSYINIFHEVAHLIDANSPGGNYFSTALTNADHPWIDQDGKIDRDVLNGDVSDPYWTTPQDALQGTDYSGTSESEQWGDTLANYVAGNINMSKDAGRDMYNFTRFIFVSLFYKPPMRHPF